jgi:protein-disulfide isomerase
VLPPTETLVAERVLGPADAPVTIIEYSSMTCPHCALFHRDTLPRIKDAYIDSGKVRVILRDFPLEPRATAAAMIARCVEPSRYFGFVEILFRDLQTWAGGSDPLKELQTRARLAYLADADFQACLDNQELLQGIQRRAKQGEQEMGVTSTPTFFVNGRRIQGAQPFEKFQAAIEAELKGPSPAAVPAETTPPKPAGGWLDRLKQYWSPE